MKVLFYGGVTECNQAIDTLNSLPRRSCSRLFGAVRTQETELLICTNSNPINCRLNGDCNMIDIHCHILPGADDGSKQWAIP